MIQITWKVNCWNTFDFWKITWGTTPIPAKHEVTLWIHKKPRSPTKVGVVIPLIQSCVSQSGEPRPIPACETLSLSRMLFLTQSWDHLLLPMNLFTTKFPVFSCPCPNQFEIHCWHHNQSLYCSISIEYMSKGISKLSHSVIFQHLNFLWIRLV